MKKVNSGTKIHLLGILAAIIISAGLILSEREVAAVFSSGDSAVKVLWSMASEKENILNTGIDDAIDAGAQFIPFGKYQESRSIAVCAIVSVSGGGQGINVSDVADSVFYPEGIYLGPDRGKEQEGCGRPKEQGRMVRLDKNTGFSLFCEKIKNYNNNLPSFNGGLNNYDDFCRDGGELMNETSAVFCSEKNLFYDDPSGVYRIRAEARDSEGNIYYYENNFTYLPLSALEMDFDSIEYGAVRAGKKKIIDGDLVWGNGVPTIRNAGNTRLSIEIVQGSMGLNEDGEISNVEYGAKIGENEKSWVFFNEGIKQKLQSPLNLSEMDRMDFSIYVYRFPSFDRTRYNGGFTLSAMAENHLNCDGLLPFVPPATILPTPEIVIDEPVSTPSVSSEDKETVAPDISPEPSLEPSADPSPDVAPSIEPQSTLTPAPVAESMPAPLAPIDAEGSGAPGSSPAAIPESSVLSAPPPGAILDIFN